MPLVSARNACSTRVLADELSLWQDHLSVPSQIRRIACSRQVLVKQMWIDSQYRCSDLGMEKFSKDLTRCTAPGCRYGITPQGPAHPALGCVGTGRDTGTAKPAGRPAEHRARRPVGGLLTGTCEPWAEPGTELCYEHGRTWKDIPGA